MVVERRLLNKGKIIREPIIVGHPKDYLSIGVSNMQFLIEFVLKKSEPPF